MLALTQQLDLEPDGLASGLDLGAEGVQETVTLAEVVAATGARDLTTLAEHADSLRAVLALALAAVAEDHPVRAAGLSSDESLPVVVRALGRLAGPLRDLPVPAALALPAG